MLRDKVVRQQGHAAYLAAENAQLKREKAAMQKEFDDCNRHKSRSSTEFPPAADVSLFAPHATHVGLLLQRTPDARSPAFDSI